MLSSLHNTKMERYSLKLAFFLALFMAASLLISSVKGEIRVGPNNKQLFMTGQLCKSHDDCKANGVYAGNFCVNKMSGEFGHCVGYDELSRIGAEEKKKSKGKCGKCKTSADCKDCPAPAACETIVLDHMCA